MSSPHSTVTYVEPNMADHDWQPKDVSGKSTDDYERAPRLEDYCIAMNIEVEISSRDSQGTLPEGDKDVLILQWNNSKLDKVSFMSGTRIGGYDYNGLDRTPRVSATTQNLTTYYADMYVGDLVHYGTTEMIGIKSVNIEYAKSCVPIITVQFTDVRGLSLFQPTELSRDNTYNGIKGLNKDNVAQSFFQCFFKMPLPKFTIYIKGFYGNPVAYVCMCDKFDTNFNSDTGDFDVTARFIGYSYSFMTDVSFDALLAAPYSDFFGRQYWDDNIQNDRFWIWDKLKTHHMPMPTLYEIHRDFKRLIQSSDAEMEKTTLTEEEKTHENEIESLYEIRRKYQQWYEQLFTLLKRKYGKRYCFDFKENIAKDADWYRILILTNSKTINEHDLSGQYTQYDDAFKKTNDDLYAAIEEFNNSGFSYKKLKNVSKDFSEYTRIYLFNDCYVDKKTRKIEFGGFSKKNKLNKVQVVNRLFHTNVASSETINETTTEINSEWISKHGSTIKDFTLSTIYNDGVDQYKDAFLIEVDYSDIKRRINSLNAHAKKSDEEKEKEKARKEHNRIMLGKMNWYPSIENFTKIMMAHLETFMMMMYNVAEKCSDRTPSKLGITIGKDGDACDVNENSGTVPPFPRVVKSEIGEDGITKTVDTWVGEYKNGEGFIEADMINGLFNAVEYIQELVKEEKESEQTSTNNEEPQPKLIVKHPLTSYDFFLTKSPYGSDSDIANNSNAFAGKVAMRMFDILSINNFKKQYPSNFDKKNVDFIKKLGTIEAENFHNDIKITNNTILGMLGVKSDSATITPQAIIDCVKNDKGIGGNNNLPWITSNTDDGLFDIGFWLTRYTTSYSSKQKSFIYPMQDTSFDALDQSLKIFNKGADSIQHYNKNIIVNWINPNVIKATTFSSNYDISFGSVFIEDNYKTVSNTLDVSNSTPNGTYTDIYNMLHEDSVFNAERYKEMIYSNGVFRPKQGVITKKSGTCSRKIGTSVDSLMVYKNRETNQIQCTTGETVEYKFESEKLNTYTTDIENGNITSWFLTECRGFDVLPTSIIGISNNKSLFAQDNYESEIENISWGFGSSADKRTGFFLMGLEAIDYTSVAKHLNSDETFTYIPKLAVLQIGAALATLNNINGEITNASLLKKIMIPRSFDKIYPYLNKINYTTRATYIKYFKDWVIKYYAEIKKNLASNLSNIACIYEIDGNKRFLFREDSEYISILTNNLMSSVLVAKGNVNHFKDVTRDGLTFDEYVATNYLDGFLGRLRELYGTNEEPSGGDAVQLVQSSSKTTEDMKKELYRYLKLVYDKWVPAMEKSSWRFETFFDEGEEELIKGKKGCDGHLFHFIDSFYNKIGDKLLINPRLLSDKIDAALQVHDVNTMMLGFMADIYSQNKCMLMCLQNFLDFGSKDGGMTTMFKPIPYNEMPKPHKHPDFVVVYPYEPSKYLNVDNGEFNNDSFMLNDEFDTPLAVKSREMNDEKCYRIPAFGVSYGKQYQSYFKKVNVGMANPIATQQAIMAKHAILRASQDTTTKSTVAQDMYDIYATQSYTCTVEMLGCAWIQPLMYFVLTNVPMFRGSYLIFKVNHKITPGNMITTFQGTRMANVSNKLVEDIFTDEDFESGTQPYLETKKHEKADINNDCPYKVFPLFEDTNIEISDDEMTNAKNAMDKLIGSGFTKTAAAAICGNIYAESRWKLHVGKPTGKGAFALCQWTSSGNRKARLVNKYGTAPTFAQQMEFINLEFNDEIVDRGGLGDSIAKKHKSEIYNSSLPDSTRYVWKYYERAGDDDKSLPNRQKRAELYFNNYGSTSTKTTSEPDKEIKKDIYQAFFDAVQKSINTTTHACELKKEMYINPSDFSDGIMMIKQTSGTDKLALVFDIILNGYYQYVQKLWWVSPSNDFNSEPLHIDVTLAEKPKPENRLVLGMVTKKADEAMSIKFGSDASSVNKSFLKSIYKKYKGLNKEIPQFDNKDIFKEIEIQSCDTVGQGGGANYPSQGSNSTWAKSVQSMGKWYEANVHTYQNSTPPSKGSGTRKMYDCPLVNGKVGDDCSGYVSACLQYFGAFKKGQVTSSYGFTKDASIASTLEKGGFKKMSYSWDAVQPYDIISYRNGDKGHVEILAEKGDTPKSWGWGSVHDGRTYSGKKRDIMPAKTGSLPKGNTYQVIWRYVG